MPSRRNASEINSEARTSILIHKYLHRPYKLHTVDHGGDGPSIILLHGLASSSQNWRNLIPLLKPHYRCITIDLIGFGESPKPQWYDYTLEDHVHNVHAAIKNLDLEDSFILVGHSLGSLIATRYARIHQQHVNRLILLSPPVYMPLDLIDKRSARQRTSLYLRAYRFLRTHKRVTPENVLKMVKILPITKMLVLNRATWVPFIRSLEQCIENQTIIEDIAIVHAPVDIFYGRFDEVIVPYNIKQLAHFRDVHLHPLSVDHIVGKRYAKSVARLLNSEV